MSFLGSLLREGTQAGMGYLQGRDQRRASDAQAQLEAEERERKKKRDALEEALLQGRIDHTTAQTERLRAPEPVKLPSQFELDGMIREYVTEGASDQVVLSRFQKTHKDIPVSMARAGLARIRESEASATRAQDAAARAAGSQQRSVANEARARQLQAATAHAYDAKQRGLDYNATLAELRTKFPNAPEEVILGAATRAHSGGRPMTQDEMMFFMAMARAGLSPEGGG